MLDTASQLRCRLVCRKWRYLINTRIPIQVQKKRYFDDIEVQTFKKIFTHSDSCLLENPQITLIRNDPILFRYIEKMSFRS